MWTGALVCYPMSPTVLDEHLEVLANEHRRRVLEYLRRGQRQVATVDELAEHLRTHRELGSGGPSREDERLRISLVHLYLPQLEEQGLLDWDRRHDEVRYRGGEVVERVLDALAEDGMAVQN